MSRAATAHDDADRTRTVAAAQVNAFFASEYPILSNFTMDTDDFVASVPANGNWSCLVGQAYPTGWSLWSTCVYFPFQNGFPVEGLIMLNLLAGTCGTDLCNRNCLDTPSWAKGQKANVSTTPGPRNPRPAGAHSLPHPHARHAMRHSRARARAPRRADRWASS